LQPLVLPLDCFHTAARDAAESSEKVASESPESPVRGGWLSEQDIRFSLFLNATVGGINTARKNNKI